MLIILSLYFKGAAMAYDPGGVFEQAVGALKENPRGGLKPICEALGVERHTVERAFQLKTGKPFRSFRRELLLERSMGLLASKRTVPIKEIAFLLGYKSERAFARFIRNALGCCPGEVRRQLRGSGGRAGKVPAQIEGSGSMGMRRSGPFLPPLH
jgi:AraC-like DNA-binding protein